MITHGGISLLLVLEQADEDVAGVVRQAIDRLDISDWELYLAGEKTDPSLGMLASRQSQLSMVATLRLNQLRKQQQIARENERIKAEQQEQAKEREKADKQRALLEKKQRAE